MEQKEEIKNKPEDEEPQKKEETSMTDKVCVKTDSAGDLQPAPPTLRGDLHRAAQNQQGTRGK